MYVFMNWYTQQFAAGHNHLLLTWHDCHQNAKKGKQSGVTLKCTRNIHIKYEEYGDCTWNMLKVVSTIENRQTKTPWFFFTVLFPKTIFAPFYKYSLILGRICTINTNSFLSFSNNCNNVVLYSQQGIPNHCCTYGGDKKWGHLLGTWNRKIIKMKKKQQNTMPWTIRSRSIKKKYIWSTIKRYQATMCEIMKQSSKN